MTGHRGTISRRWQVLGLGLVPAGFAAHLGAVALVGTMTGSPALGVIVGSLLLLALLPANRHLDPATDRTCWRPTGRPAVRLALCLVGLVVVWLLSQVVHLTVGRYFPAGSGIAQAAGHPVLLLTVAVVFGPLAEEVLLRDTLHRHLSRLAGTAASVATSAAVFALLHVEPARVLAMLLPGVYFAVVFDLWGRSVLAAWSAHALFNLAALLVPAGWVSALVHPLPISSLLVGLAALVFGGLTLRSAPDRPCEYEQPVLEALRSTAPRGAAGAG